MYVYNHVISVLWTVYIMCKCTCTSCDWLIVRFRFCYCCLAQRLREMQPSSCLREEERKLPQAMLQLPLQLHAGGIPLVSSIGNKTEVQLHGSEDSMGHSGSFTTENVSCSWATNGYHWRRTGWRHQTWRKLSNRQQSWKTANVFTVSIWKNCCPDIKSHRHVRISFLKHLFTR